MATALSQVTVGRWNILPSWISQRRKVLALLFLVALVLRAPFFGNPDYHVDEEFYFLVADRMWHGGLPFVDIWDRKPIGLFLIYAALWPLRHSDMLAVQIAGLIFATVTSYVLWLIARRQLAAGPACLPALLYLVWLPAFGGANGQSPVFYNLFMALAALLLLRAGDESASPRFERNGLVAMLMIGLAIQVKYTAVVEGAFFGLYFVALAGLRGLSLPRLARLAVLGALCTLAPTLLAVIVYAILGHLDAFLFANFVSIFDRARLEEQFLKGLILFIVAMGLPLFVAAFAGALKTGAALGPAGRCPPRDRVMLIGWGLAAFGGFMSIGNFYDHYTIPLLPPLLALTACLFEAVIPATILFSLLAVWPTYWVPTLTRKETHRSRETIYVLAKEIRPYLRHGGLFIYDGPSFLYTATGADIPTPYAYPDHLSNAVEQNALGIDTGKEMARILATRPAVIITSDKPLIPRWNMMTRPLVSRALANDYVEIDRRPEGWGHRNYILNVRRDLIQRPARPHLGISKSLAATP